MKKPLFPRARQNHCKRHGLSCTISTSMDLAWWLMACLIKHTAESTPNPRNLRSFCLISVLAWNEAIILIDIGLPDSYLNMSWYSSACCILVTVDLRNCRILSSSVSGKGFTSLGTSGTNLLIGYCSSSRINWYMSSYAYGFLWYFHCTLQEGIYLPTWMCNSWWCRN